MLPEHRPILCLVTDRRRLCPSCEELDVTPCLLEQVRAAVQAGVDLVQIRERDLEAAALLALAAEAARIARGSATRIVVNDRLDVALAAGADGVHLPGGSMPPAAVRTAVPSGFLVGRSVHGIQEAARTAGADYVIAGTVYGTMSKPDRDRLLGQAGLAAIVRAVRVPVLAIGGVTLDRLRAIAGTGAAGVAAIGLFLGEASAHRCRAIPLDPVVGAVRAGFDTATSASYHDPRGRAPFGLRRQ